jgi:hypothetical protein
MSFVPAFAVSQNVGSPSLLVITDTSTGSDSSITERRVYLKNAAGQYVVPSGTTTDYILWSISDPSIAIDVLSSDMALQIRVDWVDISNIRITQDGNFRITEDSNYRITQ